MRTLYFGAGLALIIGLAVGMTLRPQLDAVPPASAPQASAEDRSAPAAWPPIAEDDASGFAADPGQVPDYVQGTDQKKLAVATPAAPPKPGTPKTASATGVPESVAAALAAAVAPTSESASTAEGRSYYTSPIRDDQPIATASSERGRRHAADGAASPSAEAGTATDAAATGAEPALPPVALATDGHDDVPPEATGDTRVGN